MGNGMTRRDAGATLLGLGASLWSARPGAAATPRRGGTLTTFTSGYRTLNAAVQSGAATGIPSSQLFAGLVLIDEAFTPQPYLARSWTVSEDGRTYTFALVPGATFHDGAPITAADVAYSIGTVRKHHPFGPAMLGTLSGTETPDPTTLVVRLSAPAPYLLQVFQPFLMPVLPKHVYDDGRDIASHPRNMQDVVGSGPFRLETNKIGEYLSLVRHPGFFIPDRPVLDRIVMRWAPDELARIASVEQRSVDYAPFAGLLPRSVPKVEKIPNATVTTRGYEALGNINYLELNLRRKPFNDVRVRRAIAHAVDKAFTIRALLGRSSRVLDGPLYSKNPMASDGLTRYPFDLKAAAALLDQAGLKPDGEGVRFSFTLDVNNWSPQNQSILAEYLKVQLKKIGIAVTLRPSPDFATWVSRVSGWEYDATMNGIWNYPDPVIGIHRLFASGNIRKVIWSNTQGYANPAVDALLEQAAVETDVAKRKQLYADFQRQVTEDVALVFLNEEDPITVMQNAVKDPPLSVWGAVAPWDRVWVET